MAVPCVLGIDPGYGRVGYGVIFRDGRTWKYLAHGCIETKGTDIFVDRLTQIYTELQAVIQKFPITHAAVEQLYFYKNVTTGIDVGQARGVILLTLVQAQIPIYEYTPLQIKQAIAGYGKADKNQVKRMVELQLSRDFSGVIDDAVDGLAIALTASSQITTS